MINFVNSTFEVIRRMIRGEGSFIRKLLYRDMHLLEGSIKESRESISRLEIMNEEMLLHENDIKSHEKLLTIATDNLDSPIWGKDINSNFVFMNDACARKIMGKSVADALVPNDENYVMNTIEKVCMDSDTLVQDTMKTHRFFEHAILNDGNSIWLDTTKSPWVLDGVLVGTVGVGKDITQYVPDDVKAFCRNSDYIEIEVDLMYNKDDIRKIAIK